MTTRKKTVAKTVKVTATVLAVSAILTYAANRILTHLGSTPSPMVNLAVFTLAVVCILAGESVRAWLNRP